MELKDARLLIVEDNKDIRDNLEMILRNNHIDYRQIEYTDNSSEARELIEEFEPHVMLLDIKIPREKNGIDDAANSLEVIERVKLYNSRHNEKIKIIIISGTITDKAIQDIIRSDNKNILEYIDKALFSSDPDRFQEKLMKTIRRALREENTGNDFIDYSFIRREALQSLKKTNIELWKKIDEEIIEEFERLTDKKANEHIISRQIIHNCGQIVEILVHLLEGKITRITDIKTSDDYESIRRRLNSLSGRTFNEAEKKYDLLTSPRVISRKACEYAYRAYWLRNQASHAPETDSRNMNIYADNRFNKWDAVIAIDLIMPLLTEYTEQLKNEKTNL